MRFLAVFILTAAVLSASWTHAADDKAKWTRCKHARYKAQQIGSTVIIVAFGTHPTAGYKAKFRRLPIEIYPPQFEFLDNRPSGFAAQVITPFAEIAHFNASRIVKSVVVHDSHGKHRIKLTAYASAATSTSQTGGYLTPDGKLSGRLVFTDSQTGFAGVTGTIWTIEPAGAWKRQTFLNKTIRPADQSGKLNKRQLKQLAGVLKANRVRKLPARLGTKPMVNPKQLTLAFAGKQSTFFLTGGGQLPKVNPRKSVRQDVNRFVSTVRFLRKLLPAKSSG